MARTSDNTAWVWNVQTGAEEARLAHDGLLAVAFSPDGLYIATGSADGSTRIWSRDARQLGRTTTDRSSPTFAAVFSPDGQYLATGGFSFAAHVVAVPAATDVLELPLDDSAQSLAWSPDGSLIAAASSDGTARIWTRSTGHEIARMPMGFNNVVYGIAFSPDATLIATASADGVVRTWQATKAWQAVGLNHDDSVIAVAFSGDGRFLASSAGNVAHVWDAHSGIEVQRLVHPALAWALHFSPDSRYLATSGFDGYARIWDVTTGQQVHYLAGGDDHDARIWDIATGGRVMVLPHGAGVNGVAFSADGSYLATAAKDGVARIWLVSSGKQVAGLAHDKSLNGLAFNPDGSYLATASSDHTVRLWRPLLSDPIGAACAHVIANLSPSEWLQYLPGEPYRRTCPDLR